MINQRNRIIKRGKNKLQKFIKEYEDYKNLYNIRNHQNINEIRDVINKYGENAKIHLGGIPMIADDMMSYIKATLSYLVLEYSFIVLTLWLIFKNLRWVIMPLLGCAIGYHNDWFVRIDRMESSNFIKLYCVNAYFKYGDEYTFNCKIFTIKKEFPQLTKRPFLKLVKRCCNSLYCINNDMCILSLVLSGIKPIIDFGWMMTLGLIISFLVTFLLVPSLISLLGSENEIGIKDTEKSLITSALGSFTKNNKIVIFGSTFLIILMSIVGILRLEVENSFINYFDKETEIYKGMKKIDDELGGTTPLNIIIKFPSNTKATETENDEFDEWDEEEKDSEVDKSKYWFTRDKMDKIIKVHDYLDSLPEIGKVLSFGSILRVAEDLNNKKLQSLEIAVLYSKIPNSIKNEIVTPYISVDKDEARISVRIKDSLENLEETT